MLNRLLLAGQKYLVLRDVYPSTRTRGDGRWQPNRLLGNVHECPNCECRHLDETEQKLFWEAVVQATNSKQFSKIFAGWNSDGTVVGLFGVLKESPTATTSLKRFFTRENPRVLLGEWPARGVVGVLTYRERLEAARKHFLSYRFLRLTIAIFGAGFGLYLVVHGESHGAIGEMFTGACVLLIVLMIAIASIKKYRLLGNTNFENENYSL